MCVFFGRVFCVSDPFSLFYNGFLITIAQQLGRSLITINGIPIYSKISSIYIVAFNRTVSKSQFQPMCQSALISLALHCALTCCSLMEAKCSSGITYTWVVKGTLFSSVYGISCQLPY